MSQQQDIPDLLQSPQSYQYSAFRGQGFPKAHISGREALVATILEAANDVPHAQAEPVDAVWLKHGLRRYLRQPWRRIQE